MSTSCTCTPEFVLAGGGRFPGGSQDTGGVGDLFQILCVRSWEWAAQQGTWGGSDWLLLLPYLPEEVYALVQPACQCGSGQQTKGQHSPLVGVHKARDMAVDTVPEAPQEGGGDRLV